MMMMMMRLFQAHLPPTIFSHYTTLLQTSQKTDHNAQGPNHPENADHLDDGIDTNLADGTNDAWTHEKGSNWRLISRNDVGYVFLIFFNYVEDQVYNLTWLLFDVYLASSCQLLYHSYDVSQVFFTLTQILQPTIQTAWVFNLQAPEHLKLCWWWCQQEWQPWNRCHWW